MGGRFVRRRLLGFATKRVSDARLRDDLAGQPGAGEQFAAEVRNGDAQKMLGVLIVRATPEFVNQLIMSLHLAGVARQNFQQIIFGGGEFHWPLLNADFAAAEIHFQAAGTKDFMPRDAKSPAGGGPEARQ